MAPFEFSRTKVRCPFSPSHSFFCTPCAMAVHSVPCRCTEQGVRWKKGCLILSAGKRSPEVEEEERRKEKHFPGQRAQGGGRGREVEGKKCRWEKRRNPTAGPRPQVRTREGIRKAGNLIPFLRLTRIRPLHSLSLSPCRPPFDNGFSFNADVSRTGIL